MLRRWLEEFAGTKPSIFSLAGAPPAEPPSPDEQRALNAELRTFGSKDVADAYDEFMKSMLEFNAWAVQARTAIEVQAAQVPREQLEAARMTVFAHIATIERLVRDELAKL